MIEDSLIYDRIGRCDLCDEFEHCNQYHHCAACESVLEAVDKDAEKQRAYL